MSKYSKSNNPPSCFSSILQRIICTGNLPTHPSPPDQTPEKHEKSRSFSRPLTDTNGSVHAVQPQVQVSSRPGVIARLMGLDSLPNYDENVTTLDSLFRSKSLNSLHFLPDFDPTRTAFHRRARTSASFHEQGRNHNFFVTKVDHLESEVNQVKKEAVSKASKECKKTTKDSRSKKRYEECYTSTSSSRMSRMSRDNDDFREKCGMRKRKLVNNDKGKLNGKVVGSTIVSSKKKVDHEQDMCVEAQSDDQSLSRSPVSVLDHPSMEISPFFKGERRQITSNSRGKASPKNKIDDNLPQDRVPKSKVNYEDCCNSGVASKKKLVQAEVEAAETFADMLGNICKLAEKEHILNSKWVTKYELLKVHFVEEVCFHLGPELLDLLLDELLDELVMSL